MNAARDQRLDQIRQKVAAGERLSPQDGEYLFRGDVDLHAVGRLADLVRRRKHGEVAYYNLNSHLNPTNVCVYVASCKFCAYARRADDAEAFVMSSEEILARGREAAENGCTELHIVGGLHPEKPFAWYRDLLAGLHQAYPRLLLKAWTAVEIAWFARRTRQTVESILRELIDAGLCCLPGGGAEIFDPGVRRLICPGKADGHQWLEVHRTAHRLGLPTNCTMLYGHVEKPSHRVDHLVRLRELQDTTGGFQTFIPLPFHPDGTRLADLRKPSSFDDLRTMAVSRLMLDNVPHVKAYWVSLGVGTAQIALGYGADDLDGTVRHELIYHDAGSQAPEVLGVEQLCRLIAEAGRQPVERDSLYRRVRRHGLEWEVVSG